MRPRPRPPCPCKPRRATAWRLWLVLPMLCALGAAASGQEITVRSGEHGPFTRLVLQAPEAFGWALGRAGNGYDLRVSPPPEGFETATVYDRIDRARIADLATQGADTLRISLGCLCHAEAFELRPGIVVVDIRDGPAPADAAFEAPLDGQAAPAPEALARPRLASARPAPALRLPPPWPGRPAAQIFGEFLSQSTQTAAQPPAAPVGPVGPAAPAGPPTARAAAPAPAPAPAAPPAAGPDMLETLRSALLADLGSAASDGIVAFEPGAQPGAFGPDSALPPNLRVETGVDRALAQRRPRGLTANGAPCRPNGQVALAAWGDERPPMEQIGAARAALLDGTDTPDTEAAKALARTYLHFGFGAEAAQVLEAFAISPQEAPGLHDLALMVDGLLPEDPERYVDQMSCDSNIALWAVLAQPEPGPPASAPIETGAVRRAFSLLPLHLRRHLGPILAQRFVQRGDLETARALSAAIGRAVGGHGNAVAVMEARLTLAEDAAARTADDAAPTAPQEPANAAAPATKPGPEHEEALQTLANLSTRGDAVARAALQTSLEEALRTGRAADAQLLDMAEALLHETRGAEDSRGLARAAARVLARGGRFAPAFRQIEEFGLWQDGPTVSDVFTALATSGPDAELLRRAYPLPEADPAPALDAGARQALAARLLALGFGARAEALLAASPTPDAPAVRLLMGAAALAREAPDETLRAIAGLSGPEATRLRAEAHLALGAPESAAPHIAALPDAASRADLAWRAGNWALLAETGTEAQKALATRRLAPETSEAPEAPADGRARAVPSLAESRALLSEGAALRAAVSSLLPATGAGAGDGTRTIAQP